jgi:hypothetical protein
MAKNSNYLVFVDEAGDHTIAHTYPEFPLLVLAFVIISKDEYCDRLLPKFARLKVKHFGDYRRAKADFEQALRIDPNTPNVRNNLERLRREGY